MNTTKKLIIGTAALLAVVIGMQSQEENVFIGHREVLDYSDSGLKEFKRAHRLYMATRLDLSNNNLGELVLPAGMVYLKTINLTGNNNLTNLVLQQDTAIEWPTRLNVYLDDVSKVRISVPSWIYDLRITTLADPSLLFHSNRWLYDKYLARKPSIYHVRKDGKWVDSELWQVKIPIELASNLEVRPNGVEMIRRSETLPAWKNSYIVCWGRGDLEETHDLENGKWRKYFSNNPSPSERTRFSIRASRIEDWWPVTLTPSAHPSWGSEWQGFFRLKPWSAYGITPKKPEPTPIQIPTKEIENKPIQQVR